MKYIIEFEDEPCMYEDGMKFYKCIQAPWWGLSERVIKQLTPYQPDIATGTNVGDTISRQVAIDALDEQIEQCNRALGAFYISLKDEYAIKVERASLKAYKEQLENMPSAQPEPSEITDEQAILHLQSTGWMQNHDREIYESGLKERLADDSESYDSLIPYEDDGGTISRRVAVDVVDFECGEWRGLAKTIIKKLEALPAVQPDHNADVGKKVSISCGQENDLISRQAARHALCKAVHKGEDIPCENQTASCLWTGTRVCDYVREIDALPTVQPERIWHSCKTPPKHHKDVLVRGTEAIGNVTVYKVMQWDVDAWRPTDYAPSIIWKEWSEIYE